MKEFETRLHTDDEEEGIRKAEAVDDAEEFTNPKNKTSQKNKKIRKENKHRKYLEDSDSLSDVNNKHVGKYFILHNPTKTHYNLTNIITIKKGIIHTKKSIHFDTYQVTSRK